MPDYPFKLASRKYKKEDTIININGNLIGEGYVCLIAGPCTVETREQTFEVAEGVEQLGLKFFRGGLFKGRTSPYGFQGLKDKGFEIFKEIKNALGLVIVSEVTSSSYIPQMMECVDILQIGSRNMQNYEFLKEVARTKKPILLKRHFSANIEELLLAAEFILLEGNEQVILCERGIKTFEPMTRNTFDINAIPLLKELTHLPVIADPSHGTGIRSIVNSVGKAAIMAGADGLIVEVHNNPDQALCDGFQSITLKMLSELLKDTKAICDLLGKKFN